MSTFIRTIDSTLAYPNRLKSSDAVCIETLGAGLATVDATTVPLISELICDSSEERLL